MRFKDMLRDGVGKDAPARKVKPYADDTVRVGDSVRIKGDFRTVVGTVVGTAPEPKLKGECWIIAVNRADKYGHEWVDQLVFHKSYCERIRAKEMSKIARKDIKAATTSEPIFGDGDLD